MTTLLMSSRHTEDDQALWRAAIGRGWSVDRARGIRLRFGGSVTALERTDET